MSTQPEDEDVIEAFEPLPFEDGEENDVEEEQ